MKKLTSALLAVSLVLMAGCGDSSAIGIIGGVDDRSSAIVERSQEMVPPESPPAEPETDSSQPEPNAEPEPSAKPEAPSAASPASAPQPTAKPTAAPTPTPAPNNDGAPEISLSSNTVKAGDYITINAKNISNNMESITAKAEGVGTTPAFFPTDDGSAAMFAVSRNTALGNYTLVVNCKDADGNAYTEKLPFTIADAGFEREDFQMEESVVNSTVNSNTAREEYNRITASVMAASTADPDAPDVDGFIMPVNPPTFKISSSYGFTRIVNGKVSGRHEGVDFPAPKGTPVVAAGGGRVLYAGLMQMTGNTVVIEHGRGLKSWYQHLDSLDCATDDILAAGDPVGKVGTTGYSTGNHLHFGMSVNDIYTNPWQFIPRP